MCEPRPYRCAMTATLALLVLATSPTVAGINLEFRPAAEPCTALRLEVHLYAVSDNGSNQSISAMDVILSWDAEVLELDGVNAAESYPYAWLFSGFTNDQGLDGLNNTWDDGNALYTAMAQLGGPPAYATPDGLLVTTFRFRKLHVGTATSLTMLDSFGHHTHTVVYDGFTPALDVTGTLGSSVLVPSAKGDLNCDGVINFGDINPFVLILTSVSEWQAHYPGCDSSHGDLNCDGSINFFDINPFVAVLSGE